MQTTTDTLAAQRQRYPLLVLDGTWDPDEPPFDVWDNVWADRLFWVTYTIERYYARLGRVARRRTPSENAAEIIGDLAELMFSGDVRDDPHCRAAAWDTIVTVACQAGSRVVIRMPQCQRVIAVCDSPEAAARFTEADLPALVRRLASGRWRNEWQRQGTGRAA